MLLMKWDISVSTIVFTIQLFLIRSLGSPIAHKMDATKFLEQFGYVHLGNDVVQNLVDVTSGLKQFQAFMGLRVTGELDAETIKMMNTPRCGNPDIPSNDVDTRSKRYALNNGKWKHHILRYQIHNFPLTLNEEDVHRDVDKAFKLWEMETNLTFIKQDLRNPEKVDIEVRFVSGDHSDGYKFDGPGTVLAHAFQPGSGLGGDVHFDEAEYWTVDSKSGENMLMVATHEIGHALGLSHSAEKGAIMGPASQNYNPNLQLTKDDIRGIQSLYGYKKRDASVATFAAIPEPRTPKPELPRITYTGQHHGITGSPPVRSKVIPHTRTYHQPSTVPKPDPCKDSNFHLDAITTTRRQKIYLFAGDYVYQMKGHGDGVVNRWPTRTELVFKGLHGKIDAAVTLKNGATYFFKNDKYWRFHDTSQDANYPKDMSKHFPGIPFNIDAVFEQNGQMYFFKDTQYWVFDPRKKPHHVDESNYPKFISDFGLPRWVNSIDAAFVAPNGSIFLFKDRMYWRLDDKHLKVMSEHYTRVSWFKCST